MSWFQGLGSINVSELSDSFSAAQAFVSEKLTEVTKEAQESFRKLNVDALANATLPPEEQRRKAEEELKRSLRVRGLPWETSIKGMEPHVEALMSGILNLSLDALNFTSPPPLESDFPGKFDLDAFSEIAIRSIEADPNLAKLHAKLISSTKETEFWCNYFYRVEMLRAEFNFEPLYCRIGETTHTSLSTGTGEQEDPQKGAAMGEDLILGRENCDLALTVNNANECKGKSGVEIATRNEDEDRLSGLSGSEGFNLNDDDFADLVDAPLDSLGFEDDAELEAQIVAELEGL